MEPTIGRLASAGSTPSPAGRGRGDELPRADPDASRVVHPTWYWSPKTFLRRLPLTYQLILLSLLVAGGFVAILTIVRFGFFGSDDSWEPILWLLAAASMTLGNLAALRQKNIVRMLAYSSIAQGGFILVPLAVAGDVKGDSAWQAVVIYLFIYGAMNLGAFAAVIAAARRTRSAEISSFAGLGRTDPGLGLMTSIFLFSLAGIQPLAGWFAKFVMFRAVFDAGTTAAVVLGVIAAVNSVVAFFYYAGITREIWFREPADGVTPSRAPTPLALNLAMVIATGVLLVIGVYPQFFARVGELAFRTG